jgi:hypothetical protein
MSKARLLVGAALLLSSIAACQAATLISTDFTTGTAPGWVLNGRARFRDVSTVDASRPMALSLTQNGGNQTGVIWTEMKYRVPSFSFIADVLIRHPGTSCPADGFAMVFGNVDDPKTVAGGGGAMGLFGGDISQFTAFEINTWRGQGLGDDDERADCKVGKHVTFAFDVINSGTDSSRTEGQDPSDPNAGGAKIGQVVPPDGMTIVNGGWFRYQWNVATDGTMSVYVSGLGDSNKQFQKVKVLEQKIGASLGAIDFEGRFGMSAATGGAYIHTDIATVRVDSPMIDPQ